MKSTLLVFLLVGLGPYLSPAQAGRAPIALCTPLISICVGESLSASQVGAPSVDSDGGNITLSLNQYGPWPQPGLQLVQLTVKDFQGKTASRTCLIRVRSCITRRSPPLWTCPSDSHQPPVVINETLSEKNIRSIITGISNSSGWIRLARTSGNYQTSSSPQLCTLTMVKKQVNVPGDVDETPYVPIKPLGRSYLGYDWEPYSTTNYSLLVTFDCTADSSSCLVNLPALPSKDYTFQLTMYTYSLSQEVDEAARFLEKVTFGPTMAEIQAFASTIKNKTAVAAANWIQNQIKLPMTSHRQFYRERAVARYDYLTPMGASTRPCQRGARYRPYAFSVKDSAASVRISPSTRTVGQLLLSINGQLRTVTDGPLMGVYTSGKVNFTGTRYNICGGIGESVGGLFRLNHPVYGCATNMYFGDTLGNPAVTFSTANPPTNALIDLRGITHLYYTGLAYGLLVSNNFNSAACSKYPQTTGYPETAAVGFTTDSKGNQVYWLFSPTFDMLNNSLQSPLVDGGGALYQMTYNNTPDRTRVRCANAPRTFLNEDTCVLSPSSKACQSRDFPDVSIPLEMSSLRTIYKVTGGSSSDGETRYVYAVSQLRQDLRYDYPPCTPGARSRWLPDCTAAKTGITIDPTTTTLFQGLIQLSTDDNPYLIDVYFPTSGAACHANDQNKFDFTVMVGSKCWLNVHADTYQVYDFTSWTVDHPGNSPTTNPIKQFADLNDTFELYFPPSHGMDRWINNKAQFGFVGRLGDVVDFRDLPSNLLDDNIAYAFGTSDVVVESGPVMVCGSPYETANNPMLYGLARQTAFDVATYYKSTTTSFVSQRTTVWTEIAFRAADQLRQRIAWALSQILVVSPDSIAVKEHTESFVAYYDIFVRNAFGNYRNVLREVSYSPLMGEMLSYLGGKSTGYVWSTQKAKQYADENYAREVMQLFSIGLYKLNLNGTRQTLGDGSFIRSYTNNDVTEYSKVWTGFTMQNRRGNIEDETLPSTPSNQVDPMQINVKWRDYFPKLGLDGQYIGDSWLLCSDLPPQHFLEPGATFRQLGSSPRPQSLSSSDVEADVTPNRFILSPSSALYKKLCNSSPGTSACRYAAKVVLNETLPCYGQECQINAPRVFQVQSGIYFEYIRRPCVNQAFPTNAMMVKTLASNRDLMCADSRTDLASTTCCIPGSDGTSGSTRAEVFTGERVPFAMAESRCSAQGLTVCQFPSLSDCRSSGGCDPNLHYWTSQGCQLKVKINLDGSVAIVHAVSDSRVQWNNIGSLVQERTVSFFRVEWSGSIDKLLMDYSVRCKLMGCSLLSFDKLCLCDVSVAETAPFTSLSRPTREEVLSELSIGALPQGLNGRSVSPGVVMYGSGTDAVFQVTDDYGRTQWRKNLRSVVNVGRGDLSFRNPVHFIAVSDPELRDAQYETDAAIDHYMYHQNTAPFLAVRLAQRFGISNPSPRYVEAIGNAFRSGIYVLNYGGDSKSFGAGIYGDLSATVAAVLLDREARSVILDVDPMHGSVQEPFLKILRLMRSLGYEISDDTPLIRFGVDLQDLIGQEPHKLPDVFSFFKPEYQPDGSVTDSGAVSPESQVLSGPKAMELANAMLSYIKYGLQSCYGGFGVLGNQCAIGSYPYDYGHSSFLPFSGASPSQVINQLSTLMTSGRLHADRRAAVEFAYNGTLAASRPMLEALLNAEQLIALTPEFHSTAAARMGDEVRGPPPKPPVSKLPYKAVVYLFLVGGYDSYSMLVPHKCGGRNAAGTTLRQQYDSERGVLALLEGSERSVLINATSSGQPCEEFALHDELTLLKKLYNDQDLLFFANAGLIDQSGMTKENYNDLSVSQLFAHNSMQQEAWAVDPFAKVPGTGILGRAAGSLGKAGYKVNAVAIDDRNQAVTGTRDAEAPAPLVVGRNSVTTFSPKPNMENYFDIKGLATQLNKKSLTPTNVFGETWSDQLVNGIYGADEMKSYLSSASLSNVWNPSSYAGSGEKQLLYQRFSTVAKLIKTHDRRGTDRDLFFVNYGGWDHHARTKPSIRLKFQALNYALNLFTTEMKAQGVWDNITIVLGSEFGRTITPNSGAGCDHAWGGHYFMMGGSVRGGRILGKYPSDITNDSPLSVGRGRLIPTTSWDAIWNGIVEWLGVNSSSGGLDQCLPNRLNTVGPDSQLFSRADLFSS